MADISKVQVGETQYDIKDETARGEIDGVVSDLCDVKTDLSDYHVVPSKNSLLWDKFVTNLGTNQSGAYSYNASTNVLTVTSSSVTGSGANLAKEKITEIFGLNSLTFPIVVSVSVKADKTCSYIIGSAARSEYVNLTANTWYRQVLTFNNSSTLTAYNWAFYSNDTSAPTVEIKDMMVCTKAAWDANNTYEPYFLPMRDGKLDITVNTFLGAHNLANNTAATVTNNGVTFTVNADKTVTATNTASGGNATCSFNVTLDAGNYILTGGVDTNRFIQLYLAASPYTTVGYDTGRRLSFSVASRTTYTLLMGINNGTAADGCVFKPMIRLASDTDATYVPFAMTNAELTDVATVKTGGITIASGTDQASILKKQGDIVFLHLRLTGVTVAPQTTIATLPTGFRPSQALNMPLYDITNDVVYRGWINSDGTVMCSAALSNVSIRLSGIYMI